MISVVLHIDICNVLKLMNKWNQIFKSGLFYLKHVSVCYCMRCLILFKYYYSQFWKPSLTRVYVFTHMLGSDRAFVYLSGRLGLLWTAIEDGSHLLPSSLDVHIMNGTLSFIYTYTVILVVKIIMCYVIKTILDLKCLWY